ncbi:GntR family transcriptional regulator [Phaeobacter marinintestinus]|uniref:GntR family transcriptional regulator n=1 Tax=Falsiphaeobacter marinintestinus TaxID=1492905 RepID=UPI0024826CBA|nr:GntR family transcriptional regulator [Phaeobacter marinintestinus]
MQTGKLVRSSLSAQIRDRLVSQIVGGELKPGDRLVELRIASEMETSQAPVREALRELEAMGLVETAHNRGARVRILSDDELREIYDVRSQLEGYAAELVARTGVSLKSSLERKMADMRRAANKSDSKTFSEHNTTFHRLIMEAAGNVTLVSLWEGLNVKSRTMLNVARHKTDLMVVTESHQRLVDALESGHDIRARDEAIAHVLDNRP